MKELELTKGGDMTIIISGSGLPTHDNAITLIKREGAIVLLDLTKLRATIERAAKSLEDISVESIEQEVIKNLQDGMQTRDIDKLLVFAASGFIERSPQYSTLASRFLRQRLYKEVFSKSISDKNFTQFYKEYFITNITVGVVQDYFDKRIWKS